LTAASPRVVPYDSPSMKRFTNAPKVEEARGDIDAKLLRRPGSR
jgi:hypothetical protein